MMVGFAYQYLLSVNDELFTDYLTTHFYDNSLFFNENKQGIFSTIG